MLFSKLVLIIKNLSATIKNARVWTRLQYPTLQDLFTTAISTEEERLSDLLFTLPDDKKSQLCKLIKQTEGITDLNKIRADQKNFQYTSVQESIDKVQKTMELYNFAKWFIPTLEHRQII